MLRNYDNLTVLADNIKDLKLNNLPTNFILNKNDNYTLIIKSDTIVLRFYLNKPSAIVYLPVIQKQYTKFIVEWGDYSNNAISTYTYTQNPNVVPSCQYNNSIKDFITIKINGDFKGFDNSQSEQSITGNYLYYGTNIASATTYIDPATSTEITLKNYDVDYYLYAIDSWGNVPIETLNKAFINASGLHLLPNTTLPNVNNCASAFMNCVNLFNGFSNSTSSMNNFQLPLNVTNCQDMFNGTNINYDFSKLNYPEYLTIIYGMFANTKISNLNNDFYYNFQYYAEMDDSNKQYLSTYYFGCLPETMKNLPEITRLSISGILLGII